MYNFGTGMSGFIGSHLAKKIDIVPIPHKKIDTIELKNYDNFFFLSSYGNLASQKGDDLIYKANVGDLITILEQSKDIKFKSFVYISSSSVLLPVQTMYSKFKKAAEDILLAYIKKYDMPICILRPFSVTGISEQREHLIPTLIKATLSGKTINFVPEPSHDFIDVEDLVDGIITLSKKGARGIFELGTGLSTSNQEVLEMVEKITGKKINVNIVDNMRSYDNKNWVSTDSRAWDFGWMPKKTLFESIKEQYESIE